MTTKNNRRCLFIPDSLWNAIKAQAQNDMMSTSTWIRVKLKDAIEAEGCEAAVMADHAGKEKFIDPVVYPLVVNKISLED